MMLRRIVVAAALFGGLVVPAAGTPAAAAPEGCVVNGTMETSVSFGLPGSAAYAYGNFDLLAFGLCASAIGIALGGDIEGWCGNMIAPNAFVVVGTTIVFHGPTLVGTGQIVPDVGESCAAATASRFLVAATVAAP